MPNFATALVAKFWYRFGEDRFGDLISVPPWWDRFGGQILDIVLVALFWYRFDDQILISLWCEFDRNLIVPYFDIDRVRIWQILKFAIDHMECLILISIVWGAKFWYRLGENLAVPYCLVRKILVVALVVTKIRLLLPQKESLRDDDMRVRRSLGLFYSLGTFWLKY